MAAVATALKFALIELANKTNRFIADNARFLLSIFSSPFGPKLPPKPQRTFSLKKYAGERAAPSKTTNLTEFDPISITPNLSIVLFENERFTFGVGEISVKVSTNK